MDGQVASGDLFPFPHRIGWRSFGAWGSRHKRTQTFDFQLNQFLSYVCCSVSGISFLVLVLQQRHLSAAGKRPSEEGWHWKTQTNKVGVAVPAFTRCTTCAAEAHRVHPGPQKASEAPSGQIATSYFLRFCLGFAKSHIQFLAWKGSRRFPQWSRTTNVSRD